MRGGQGVLEVDEGRAGEVAGGWWADSTGCTAAAVCCKRLTSQFCHLPHVSSYLSGRLRACRFSSVIESEQQEERQREWRERPAGFC